MNKIYLDSLEYNDNQVIYTDKNKIYYLSNGDYLKIRKRTNYDSFEIKQLEKKILYADKLHDLENLVKPKCIVYSSITNPTYVGYQMSKIDGVNFDKNNIIIKEEDKYDLQRYARLYLKAEQTVKEANEQGIIIPDMLTDNNVLINKDEEIKFIDYDDMQIGDIASNAISNVYAEEDNDGNVKINLSDKYYTDGLFNSNIDKQSLFYLYLENTFNLTPEEVQKLGSNKNLMQFLGINDDSIVNKFGTFYDVSNIDNDYLGDTTIDIANKYEFRPGYHGTKALYKKR